MWFPNFSLFCAAFNLFLIHIITDHPRITVGPENPLRVEKDDAAQLHCNVDSKPTGNKYALKRYDLIYTPQY